VPSRNQDFNPVYIIAEYEVLNGGAAQMTAGGRASVKLANDSVEIGASYLQEGAAAGDSRIAGTDLRWQIAPATELRAEVARSESDDPAHTASAAAYLTEVTHVSERLDTRAYLREQEAGFGVGQQAGSEAGTRKVGVDGRYRLTERFTVAAVFSGEGRSWKYAVASKTEDVRPLAAALNATCGGRGGGKPELVQGSCSVERAAIETCFAEL
jgi:hypothetical protein